MRRAINVILLLCLSRAVVASDLSHGVYTVGAAADHPTVGAALAAVHAAVPVGESTNAVVLLYPGTYAESVDILTTGITLRGVARDACVITSAPSTVGESGGTVPAVVNVLADGVAIENLTIHNFFEKIPVMETVKALKVGASYTGKGARAVISRFSARDVHFIGQRDTVAVCPPMTTTGSATFDFCQLTAGNYNGLDALAVLAGARAEWRNGHVYSGAHGGGSAVFWVGAKATLIVANTSVESRGPTFGFLTTDGTSMIEARNVAFFGTVTNPVYVTAGPANVRSAGVTFAGNTVLGLHSVAGGGTGNRVSGIHSTVGGGAVNTAAGPGATVPGGQGNTATGGYTFAAGRHAHAKHGGAFVLSDSTGSTSSPLVSSAPDSLTARFSNGYRLHGGDMHLDGTAILGGLPAMRWAGAGTDLPSDGRVGDCFWHDEARALHIHNGKQWVRTAGADAQTTPSRRPAAAAKRD